MTDPSLSTLTTVADTWSDRLEDLALTNLRRIGQRLTTGRRLLIATLVASPEPQTIPMLLRRQPALAQSSVYRNLTVLEQAGLVAKIEMGPDHAHFELSELVTGEHHHHLMCSACGSVTTVMLPDTIETMLQKASVETAEASGFEMSNHRLDLIGRCTSCVAATGSGRAT